MFSPSSPARFALAFVLVVAASTTACSRFTKTRQCRALIAQVNPALDEVQALTDAGAGGSGGVGGASATAGGGARYLAAAARYERLAKDLGPMEFSSEQTAKTVAEYASVLTLTAQNLRALAVAVDSGNQIEIDRVNRELERLTIREHAAISRIDAWCAPES